jgi:multidrug resistance efflux pump
MDVCSPKDGFVKVMIAQDGSAVKAGDDLLEMDSDREERAAEQIRVREALRQLDEAKYSGEQLALAKRIAQSAVDVGEAQLKYQKAQHDVDAAKLRTGLVAVGAGKAVEQANIDSKLAQTTFDRDRAVSDQKQLLLFIDRQLKSHALAKELNEYYAKAIQARITRLTIKAPISGHVKFHVQQGSFAQLGSTLLEIK